MYNYRWNKPYFKSFKIFSKENLIGKLSYNSFQRNITAEMNGVKYQFKATNLLCSKYDIINQETNTSEGKLNLRLFLKSKVEINNELYFLKQGIGCGSTITKDNECVATIKQEPFLKGKINQEIENNILTLSSLLLNAKLRTFTILCSVFTLSVILSKHL